MPTTRTETRWTRSVVAFFVAVLGSSLAATALTTILGKLVFDITGSELDLGLLGLAEFAPAALLVLLSGSLADRRDRRTLAAFSIFGEAVAAAGIAWYASTDPTSVTPIFALILLFGIARALAAPATRALPGDIVAPSVLPWLMVRRSATWQLASIVGPVLGGVLYAVDVTLPFVAVVGFLLLAAVAMFAVRPLPPEETAVVGGRGRRRRRRGGGRPGDQGGSDARSRRRDVGGCSDRDRAGAGADERSDGRAALHPPSAGAARRDLPRPLRGALRGRGRAAPGDRGGPSPRRRGRPGLVAGRDRHRRRARHAPPRVAAGARVRSGRSCSPRSRCSGCSPSFSA